MYTKKYLPIILLILSIPSINNAQIIKIGTQTWDTKNLNVDRFNNGDRIDFADTRDKWELAYLLKKPAWCYCENNPVNGEKFGKLYNWYAVKDPRGLAPQGWHVPSDSEWTVLTDFLGGVEVAGYKMKSSQDWYREGNGDNSSGFSGLPGCMLTKLLYVFMSNGVAAHWWSSTEQDANYAWTRCIYYFDGKAHRYNFPKNDGMSVRCLSDQ